MPQTWPLLEIRAALADADRNLADVVYYVPTLQADSEGQYPPGAALLLANIATLRELLGEVIPPVLAEAIAEEQAEYDEQEARWEASSA